MRAYFARLWSALRGRHLVTVEIGDQVRIYSPFQVFDGRVTGFSMSRGMDEPAQVNITATSADAYVHGSTS